MLRPAVFFIIPVLCLMACSEPSGDEASRLIVAHDYTGALALVDDRLSQDPGDYALQYLKAEILTHLSGVSSLRTQAIALTIQYGHHLMRYRAKRILRDKINRTQARDAMEIYLKLISSGYTEAASGRNSSYFLQAAGWLSLALESYAESEKYFSQSIENGDQWDVKRAMLFLSYERKAK